MRQEYIDVLDRFGNHQGVIKTREEIHHNGDIHRVVHIWIYNDKKELMLQKRSATCLNHPECWDISCAGHVHAMESSLECGIRELYEELGLNIDEKQIRFLTSIERFLNPSNKEIADIYLLKLNLNLKELKFIDKEVCDAKFFNLNQIRKFIDNQSEHFVLREEYPLILQEIEKDLQS